VYLLGIDAGSTKTRGILAGVDGRVVADVVSGSCNFVVYGSAYALQELEALVVNLREAVGLTAGDLVVRSAFMGSAGITRKAEFDVAEDMLRSLDGWTLDRVTVENDITLVHAGGLLGEAGIAMISGTGSNCMGRRDDGATASAGGLEWLVDDRGSGFRIGLEALVLSVRTLDGREESCPLSEKVLSSLGIAAAEDVLPRLYGEGSSNQLIPKKDVAALAPHVLSLASGRDARALEILRREAAELAVMFSAVARRLEFSSDVAVAWTIAGGVGNHESFLPMIVEAISRFWPNAHFRSQIFSPERGALLLAASASGLPNLPDFISNLRKNV
jgi:N-acetylglucosamine kinase-like BadF-type ATPase